MDRAVAGVPAGMEPGELAIVLARFDVGRVRSVGALPGGHGRCAKALIETDRGAFVVKRHGARDREAVAVSHEAVLRLEAAGLPVAPLVGTREGNASLAELGGWVYEVMGFVDGARPDGSDEATRLAGGALARVHAALRGWRPTRPLPEEGYHATARVRDALWRCGKEHGAALGEGLSERYARAGEVVVRAGIAGWPREPIHADWHPGNIVVRDGAVAAMLDFDAIRVGPAACDVARALVWFGLAGRGDPSRWRDGVSEGVVRAFASGYRAAAAGGDGVFRDRTVREAIPALMVESLIAEGALRVAERGRFGRFGGREFLAAAAGLADAIERQAGPLTRALRG